MLDGPRKASPACVKIAKMMAKINLEATMASLLGRISGKNGAERSRVRLHSITQSPANLAAREGKTEGGRMNAAARSVPDILPRSEVNAS